MSARLQACKIDENFLGRLHVIRLVRVKDMCVRCGTEQYGRIALLLDPNHGEGKASFCVGAVNIYTDGVFFHPFYRIDGIIGRVE